MKSFRKSVIHRRRVVRVPVQGRVWSSIDSSGCGSDLMHVAKGSTRTEDRFFFYTPRLSNLTRIIGSRDRFETIGHETGFRRYDVKVGLNLQDDASCRAMSCSFVHALTAFSAQVSGDAKILDSRDGVGNHFLVWDKTGNLILATFVLTARKWGMTLSDPFHSSTYLWVGCRILYPVPV